MEAPVGAPAVEGRTRTGAGLARGLRTAGGLLGDVRSVWVVLAAGVVGIGGAWAWARDGLEGAARSQADLALGDPAKGAPEGANAARWYAWISDVDGKATAGLQAARENRQAITAVQVDVRALVEGEGRDLCVQAGGIPGQAQPTPTDPDPPGVCRFYDRDFEPLGFVVLTDHAELLARVTARLEAAARRKAGRR